MRGNFVESLRKSYIHIKPRFTCSVNLSVEVPISIVTKFTVSKSMFVRMFVSYAGIVKVACS